MIIGLISDTHGHLSRTISAANAFRSQNVEAILHAGDVGDESILNELAALGVPVHAVSGNCDFDLNCPHFLDLTLGDRRFALIHGHDEILLRNTLRSEKFDYVITGHTHQRRDEHIGRTRVINPGAITRATPPTLAILNTATNTLLTLPL